MRHFLLPCFQNPTMTKATPRMDPTNAGQAVGHPGQGPPSHHYCAHRQGVVCGHARTEARGQWGGRLQFALAQHVSYMKPVARRAHQKGHY
eukprot:138861-Prorocentrum_minimum.AAC.3